MSQRAWGAERAASKQIFLQLAARAIRRVHLDAQLLGLGQSDNGMDGAIRKVNQGAGCELVPESTVRDALAQEFNGSKLGHGWKLRSGIKDPKDPEARYFGIIEREVAYGVDGDRKSKHVDLQYRRIPGPGQKDEKYPVAPVELKRARLYSVDLASGKSRKAASQKSSVLKDLRKLARLVRADRAGTLSKPFRTIPHSDWQHDSLHPQVLVWGVQEDDTPVEFMNSVFDLARACGCRPLGKFSYEWIPASWRAKRKPSVTRWLWISVATLNVSNVVCDNSECPCQSEAEDQ